MPNVSWWVRPSSCFSVRLQWSPLAWRVGLNWLSGVSVLWDGCCVHILVVCRLLLPHHSFFPKQLHHCCRREALQPRDDKGMWAAVCGLPETAVCTRSLSTLELCDTSLALGTHRHGRTGVYLLMGSCLRIVGGTDRGFQQMANFRCPLQCWCCE